MDADTAMIVIIITYIAHLIATGLIAYGFFKYKFIKAKSMIPYSIGNMFLLLNEYEIKYLFTVLWLLLVMVWINKIRCENKGVKDARCFRKNNN